MPEAKKKHQLDQVLLKVDKKKGSITLLKEWLQENYVLRVNALDTDDVYLEPTELNPVHYEYDVTEADIYLHALEDGLSVSKGLITNIIQSPNHSIHFNPIKEYLDSLKGKYNGPSQIDYLIGCLKMAEGENLQKNYNTIKKWLVAMAACCMGMRPNDVALGIISDKAGIGKTTFFEELLPQCLRKYLSTVIKSNNNQLPAHMFANKIILNFDELSAISLGTEDQFKMLMSAEKVNTNIPGTRRNKQVQRIASVCFTSNKTSEQGGFIKNADPGMLRRLAVVEIESIEDYRGVLNQNQLWAEIVMLLDGGYDYVWNQDDYKYFSQINKKYLITTNAMRLVNMYYQLPGKHDKIRYMSSRDILLELKEKKRIPSNMTKVDEVSIGQALSAAGFMRRVVRIPDIGPRYCYAIKQEE